MLLYFKKFQIDAKVKQMTKNHKTDINTQACLTKLQLDPKVLRRTKKKSLSVNMNKASQNKLQFKRLTSKIKGELLVEPRSVPFLAAM